MQDVGIHSIIQANNRPVHGGNVEWAAQLAHCLPEDILDFSASINPLGPPASAIAAIHSHLSALRAYPDPRYRNFRQVLANHHSLSADWICPGNGSAELLTWASRELAACAETILLTPAFGDYKRSIQAFGGRILECPILAEQPLTGPDIISSLDDVLKPRAGRQLGLIINNPHNPTGHLWQREEILAVLESFALVVVDEAFMDFLRPDEQASVMDAVYDHDNLVVLRSLTKFYSMPGLRIGYAIAHPERIQRWQQWRDPWPVNTLAVAAATASLADHKFQQQTWEWLKPSQSQLFRGLQEIPGLSPHNGAANYILVKTAQSAVALQRQLLANDRILIRDCVSFPELGDRYFRVAVRTEAENERLLAGLRKLG